MRRSHAANPLHRIECWTGKYFRPAELREVGMQIVIKHRDVGLCDTLRFYSTLHEATQQNKDAEDDVMNEGNEDRNAEGLNSSADGDVVDAGVSGDSGIFASDDAFEKYMNELHGQEMADNEDDPPEPTTPTETRRPSAEDICIVHINGVHRLPVLTCTCRGEEQLALDLAYARFLPTSFSRLSTIFTMAVLDDCRLANLECKVSGYQNWQRLRRLTEPLRPDDVPNRYKELLRMSRLWRWMKKLKWAGFGQDTKRNSGMAANGELSVFCPACPQPGINIEDDWQDGPDK